MKVFQKYTTIPNTGKPKTPLTSSKQSGMFKSPYPFNIGCDFKLYRIIIGIHSSMCWPVPSQTHIKHALGEPAPSFIPWLYVLFHPLPTSKKTKKPPKRANHKENIKFLTPFCCEKHIK